MRSKLILAYAIALLLLVVFVSGVLAQGIIEMASVASDGTHGSNGTNWYPSISGDGRYVAFESDATDLVSNDINQSWDIFVHDRQTNTTTCVSVASDGTQSNNPPYSPLSISSDGRYVAFASYASNLVPSDTNGFRDVFIRDRQTNTTTIISISDNGTQGNGDSHSLSISDDGRYVAFESDASNLVLNDTNVCSDVFVRDRQTNTTTRVSVASHRTESNRDSEYPNISGDGRYVVFESYASNLVPSDTNGPKNIFIHDRQKHTTTIVSLTSDGSQANNYSNESRISDDGRYVAFQSHASNLVTNDTNGEQDIFVRDLQANTITRISIDSNGTQGNADSWHPSISDDGRYVAFESDASNLVHNDTNNQSDIFVRDRQKNTTTIVSIASNGSPANSQSVNDSISGDGRYVAFDSLASNLVPIDWNGTWDVFVVDNPLYEQLPTSASVAVVVLIATLAVGFIIIVVVMLFRRRTY